MLIILVANSIVTYREVEAIMEIKAYRIVLMNNKIK